MKKKKIEFKKLVVICSFILFISTLLFCITRNFSTVLDTAVYVSAIGTTATLCWNSVKWYMQTIQTENTVKIERGTYKSLKEDELDFIEGKLKLQKKYKLSDDDMNVVEQTDNVLSSVVDSKINDIQGQINNATNENQNMEVEQIS